MIENNTFEQNDEHYMPFNEIIEERSEISETYSRERPHSKSILSTQYLYEIYTTKVKILNKQKQEEI